MSVRQEVLQILADAAEPLTSLAIFDKCREAATRGTVSVTLSGLKNDEYVEPFGKSEVEGETALVLWQITAEGRAELKALVAVENDPSTRLPSTSLRTGPSARAKAKGKRGKGKAARRAKRRLKVHKVQRRNAKKVLRRRSGQVSREAAAPRYQRWALTEDGMFVLLGAREPLEIAQPVARELLGLVRAGADLPGLAAFIEKLDQGQA